MKVAIVGAGISGVVAGAYLREVGIDIVLFERNNAPGGVWLYDKRLPLEPFYPADKPSKGEIVSTDCRLPKKTLRNGARHDISTEALKHAPPGPCYDGLSNNVASRLLELKINAFNENTPDFVNHRVLNEYIQDTSRKSKAHEHTIYNTRVENISKKGPSWQVQTTAFAKDGDKSHKVERSWEFDAVVIASGHHHACRVPDIPGLTEWKARWPDRIQHSKSYRTPKEFKGQVKITNDLCRDSIASLKRNLLTQNLMQNVLLIGSGVSSTDIARELGSESAQIYQTSRSGTFDLPASLLPPNATRIGDIASFEDLHSSGSDSLKDDSEAIPSRVFLRDGQELSKIHRIILCTGYHFSLPFFREYHDDNTPIDQANKTVLVTDGTQVHNLHKDIFYIPDPTLLFIGVPYWTATFTLFEFQAIAAANVLAGTASLPSRDAMRLEYDERVKRKGYGREFHSLKEKEVEYVDELLQWVNGEREKRGLERVEGHTKRWHEANEERKERIRKLFGRV